MGEFSLSHMLIVAIVLLIFFGPSKIPQFGQSLGKAIRGFKQGLNEIDADSKDVTHTNNQLNQNQNSMSQNQQDKSKETNRS